MNDVRRAVIEVWDRLRPQLGQNPAEVRRRLARRNSALMQQHPRAWCLAIRATDTRLPDLCALPPSSVKLRPAQDVVLDTRALRKLCAPVFLDAPGATIDQVARQLGTTRNNLLAARLANVFQHHHVAGLGGYHARPRPLLWADVPLDPASRRFLPPDRVWADSARELVRRIPDGITQTLTRVGHYHSTRPLVARPPRDDLDALHPEHPNRDLPPPRQRNYRLPPPQHDYVWYKWRDGEYTGHDWRSARSIANHHARDQRLRAARDSRKQRREKRSHECGANRSRPEPPYGPHFKGWRWLCPSCIRKVNLLFYPLPPIDLLLPLPVRCEGGEHRARWRAPAKKRAHDPAPSGCGVSREAVSGFACKSCHRVKYLSHCSYKGWNELITYLSGGLLYGHEVPRPSWYRPRRKNAYVPHPNCPPSRRRQQIERGLLAGQTIRAIATEIGLSFGTVLWYAQRIYPQHGVGCLKELLIKYGIPLRPHLRGKALGKRGEGCVRDRMRRERAAARAAASSIGRATTETQPAVLRTSAK